LPKFEFEKIVDVERDLIFQISTDYENFTRVLPEYFKQINIVEESDDITIIREKIQFLGRTVDVLTEHKVKKPDRHIVKMLDGQARGSIFDEKYEIEGERTKITINVDFVLHGGLKIMGAFAKGKIKQSMNTVINEFVSYAKSKV
jgi:carbon monoxide dehydrogenase subunit G|tara:strand:- start:4903 stop:5337 length:435 start_codon:yes stop_codon:yes gene_type:complete